MASLLRGHAWLPAALLFIANALCPVALAQDCAAAAPQAAAAAAPAMASRPARSAPAVERRKENRPWVARKSLASRSDNAAAAVAAPKFSNDDAVWKEF